MSNLAATVQRNIWCGHSQEHENAFFCNMMSNTAYAHAKSAIRAISMGVSQLHFSTSQPLGGLKSDITNLEQL